MLPVEQADWIGGYGKKKTEWGLSADTQENGEDVQGDGLFWFLMVCFHLKPVRTQEKNFMSFIS